MFAMGAIMAELFTLRPLFPGSSEMCLHPFLKVCLNVYFKNVIPTLES